MGIIQYGCWRGFGGSVWQAAPKILVSRYSHSRVIPSPWMRAGPSDWLPTNRIWPSDGISLPRLSYKRLTSIFLVHSLALRACSSWWSQPLCGSCPRRGPCGRNGGWHTRKWILPTALWVSVEARSFPGQSPHDRSLGRDPRPEDSARLWPDSSPMATVRCWVRPPSFVVAAYTGTANPKRSPARICVNPIPSLPSMCENEALGLSFPARGPVTGTRNSRKRKGTCAQLPVLSPLLHLGSLWWSQPVTALPIFTRGTLSLCLPAQRACFPFWSE